MLLLKNIDFMNNQFKIIKKQNIIIDMKSIIYIGDKVPLDYNGEMIDCTNKLALPGFYNLHCHSPMGLLRGYGEGLSLHDWLNKRVIPFEALLNSEDIYWGTMLGIAEMMQSGIVSYSDMYFELDAICKAVDESGIKANLSHGTSGFDENISFTEVNGWKGTHIIRDYVASLNHDRIVPEVGLHAEYTSKEKLVREIAQYAQENEMSIHLHISETKDEHEACKVRNKGMTPTQWFDYCGIFLNRTTAAHCVHVDENDMEILAQHDVTVAHCPSSNLKLGSGIAPLDQIMNHGIRIAIGTDGAASNNNLNILEEINLTSIVQKGYGHNPQFMNPEDVLKLATENGAIAQGRNNCGSIAVGNRADIVIFDLDKPHMQPVYDTLSNIVYASNASDIFSTIIDGKIVYNKNEFKTIDIEKVLYYVNKIKCDKLQQLSEDALVL